MVGASELGTLGLSRSDVLIVCGVGDDGVGGPGVEGGELVADV